MAHRLGGVGFGRVLWVGFAFGLGFGFEVELWFGQGEGFGFGFVWFGLEWFRLGGSISAVLRPTWLIESDSNPLYFPDLEYYAMHNKLRDWLC